MEIQKTLNTPGIIYGTAWKKSYTARLVELAFSTGFRAFDTANQLKHYDEPLMGEALRALAARGVQRESLFLQSKFTPIDGQDHRLPYDQNADLGTQVKQSYASSLVNLSVDYLDSYLLHGPYSYPGLGEDDWKVWTTLEELYASGKVRAIGISNITDRQLAELIERAEVPPMVVQNRCYASRGWDLTVRRMCQEHGIIYQGFSLLTANPSVVGHPELNKIALRLGATPEQIVYCFSARVGMVPLTGTTNEKHMQQALQALTVELTDQEVALIEKLS